MDCCELCGALGELVGGGGGELLACRACVDRMCFVCKRTDGTTAWATVPTALEKLCERCYSLWPWLGGMQLPGDPPLRIRVALAGLNREERQRFKQLYRIVDQSYRMVRRWKRYGWTASDDEIRNG